MVGCNLVKSNIMAAGDFVALLLLEIGELFHVVCKSAMISPAAGVKLL